MNKVTAWLRSEWRGYGKAQRVAVAVLAVVILSAGGVVCGKQVHNAFVGGWCRWQSEVEHQPGKPLDRKQVARYGTHVSYQRPSKPLPPIKHTIRLRAENGAVRVVGAKGQPIVAKYPGTSPGAKWSCSLWVDLTCIGRDPFGTPGAYIGSGAASCSIAGYSIFYWGTSDPDPTTDDLPTEWPADAKTEWLAWYAGAKGSLTPFQVLTAAYTGTVYEAKALVGASSRTKYKCYGFCSPIAGIPPELDWGVINYGPTEWELAASIEATPIQSTATVTDASYAKRTSPRRWTDRTAALGVLPPENSSMTATLGSMSVSAAASTTHINILAAGLPIANAQKLNTVYSKIKSLSISNGLVPCDFSALNQWTLLDQSYVYSATQPETAYSHCYGTAGGDIEAVILGPNNVSAYYDGGGSIRCIHEGLVKPVIHASWWAPECSFALPSGAQFDLGIEVCTSLAENGSGIYETVWFTPGGATQYYNLYAVAGPGSDNTIYVSELGRYRLKSGGLCCLPDPVWLAANHLNLPAAGGTLTNDQGAIAVPAMTLSLDAAVPFADCIGIAWDDVEIDIPPGQAARPSEWAGSGGLAVDPGDSGTWVVSSSPAGPTVTRNLLTRWYLRMLYCNAGIATGGNYDPDWVRQLVANENQTNDIAAWATAVPVEDVTCWLSDWLRLSFSVLPELAIGETVTATIGYSTVTIDDPCTTCFEHRVGPEGTFTFERTSGHTVEIAGTISDEGEVEFDLGLLKRTNDVNLQHVDSVTFALPSVEGTYTISGLTNFYRTEPAHTGFRVLPAADPYNWDEDYCGIAFVIGGMQSIDIPDGTEQYLRGAMGLKQTQFMQHCPDNETEGLADPVYAKALSRLVNELNWLQGITATYSSAPFYDAENSLLTEPRWWDLRRWEGYTDVDAWDLQAAIMVRKVTTLPPLIPCTVNSYWCLGGGVQGIAYSGTERITGSGEQAMPGTWSYKLLQWVGDVSSPLIYWEQIASAEPNYDGRVWIVAGVESSLAVAHSWQAQGTQPYVIQLYNRDLIPIDPVRIGLWEPFLCPQDTIGLIHLIAREDDGRCHVAYIDGGIPIRPVWMTDLPFEEGYERPSIAVADDGSLVACATEVTTGNMVIKRNRSRGMAAWGTAMTALGAGLQKGTIHIPPRSNSVWLVGHNGTDKIIVRTSSLDDLTPETINGSADIVVRATTGAAVQSSISMDDTGKFIVASGDNAGGMVLDHCRNVFEGFSEA